ncbi:hypothetical protein ACLOJK_041893 [Asimina triloba]
MPKPMAKFIMNISTQPTKKQKRRINFIWQSMVRKIRAMRNMTVVSQQACFSRLVSHRLNLPNHALSYEIRPLLFFGLGHYPTDWEDIMHALGM